MYDYQPTFDGAMGVKVNDVLEMESEQEGWYILRTVKGKRGLVPMNYCKLLGPFWTGAVSWAVVWD